MWLMCRWLGRAGGGRDSKNSRRLINKTKNLMSSVRVGGRVKGRRQRQTDSDRDQQEIWKCTEYSVGCKQTKQRESKQANEVGKGKERERAGQSGRASLN